MNEFIRIVRPKEKIRLDKYLYIAGLGVSRAQIQKLILDGKVLVNNQPAKPNTNLKLGDKVVVSYEKRTKFNVEPEAIPLDIVYEDSDIIVVNKPSGMVTHPAPGHPNGTLVNALLYHCELSPPTGKMPVPPQQNAGTEVQRPQTKDQRPKTKDQSLQIAGHPSEAGQGAGWVVEQMAHLRPGVLHRLDQHTSGLLVFAKTDIALVRLARDVELHKIKRKYSAFVWGKMELEEGTIDAPIGRHTIERKQMAVTPLRSRSAVTYYKRIREFKYITQLGVRLGTGRTHQIRVHLSHLNHPVVGDQTYGGRTRPQEVPINEFNKIMQIMERQALHAESLAFIHPISKKELSFQVPLPPDMQELEDYLSKTLR